MANDYVDQLLAKRLAEVEDERGQLLEAMGKKRGRSTSTGGGEAVSKSQTRAKRMSKDERYSMLANYVESNPDASNNDIGEALEVSSGANLMVTAKKDGIAERKDGKLVLLKAGKALLTAASGEGGDSNGK